MDLSKPARLIAGLLTLFLTGNGAFMLAQPLAWYDAVPGVPLTGAFNPHFVRDIGAAYLVSAAGLAWFAWRPRQGWPALAAGAAFLTLHAATHVWEVACGVSPMSALGRDFVGVFLPTILAVLLTLFFKPKEA
jgi:hypothetical protein